jgi:hypothetical protein
MAVAIPRREPMTNAESPCVLYPTASCDRRTVARVILRALWPIVAADEHRMSAHTVCARRTRRLNSREDR